MSKCLISGCFGLVGFATASRLLKDNWEVVGLDNDSRKTFFGESASVASSYDKLKAIGGGRFTHFPADIRAAEWVKQCFGKGVDLVVHAAAQPSHDWAATNIRADFLINAIGTLNMLEAWKVTCPKSPFIQISTSKCFGDNTNRLPLERIGDRLDLPESHPLWNGIPEDFSTSDCIRSFFGVSKFAGDLLAQEMGKNLGMPVAVMRPGCITGENHKGTEMHGFLSYLASCVRQRKLYRIYGYDGLQVRCNVHADDLVQAFLDYAAHPRPGEVYCFSGRGLECSVLEAIAECEKRCECDAITEYVPEPRRGDHRWFVGDVRKFQRDYGWKPPALCHPS